MTKYEILQHNFPEILRKQARFFRQTGNDKGKTPEGWNKPENQKTLGDAMGSVVLPYMAYPIGFDITGHGVRADYMFLDFDHVLDAETGEFVNDAAREYYEKIVATFDNIYCEKSISGSGLHMFLLPTAGKFPKITNAGERGTLWFDRALNIKLEVFYKTGGRYCLITGNYFGCEKRHAQSKEYSFARDIIYPDIPSGVEVDTFLENDLLPAINVSLEGNVFEKAEIPVTCDYTGDQKIKGGKPVEMLQIKAAAPAFAQFSATPPDTERAKAMLAKIPVADVTYSDWVAVGMILKNNGNALEDWLNWSKDDPRYQEGECFYKWGTFNDDGLTIATLHSFSRALYGYDEAEYRKEWRANLTIPAELLLTKDQRYIVFQAISGTSDSANADRLAYLFGNEFRYVSDIDGWANYDAGIWVINSNSKNTAINPIVKKAERVLKANAKTENERKIAECFSNHRKYSPAVTTLKGVTQITIKTTDLDNHKNLLNCENGVVDLETGKLYQHSPDLLLTQKCKAIYRPNYYNDTVNEFLQSIQPNEDTLAALLRFLGYSITGECSAEKFLFIDGKGGNGKGTLTKLILYIVDGYGCSFPIEGILLSKTIDANSATPAFNILEHKRLAISEEIPQGAKLNAAKVKQLTGGDMIYIRRLHQEASRIDDPTHTMIFSGNYLPEIGDVHDPGILRRLLRIQFKVDFTQAPDETLKKKLLTADARAGMLTLLVDNAREWYKHGLIISAEMKTAAKAYTESQDFIAEFIAENCVFENGASIPRKDLLSRLNEEYPQETRGLSDRALTAMIEKQEGIGYARSATNGGYAFRGIRWLATNNDD